MLIHYVLRDDYWKTTNRWTNETSDPWTSIQQNTAAEEITPPKPNDTHWEHSEAYGSKHDGSTLLAWWGDDAKEQADATHKLLLDAGFHHEGD